MRLTNTASATWHTAQGTFKASIMLHPGIACMHTLTLELTDVHTNGFSRTHFVKLLQKAVELNESAGTDDRTPTPGMIMWFVCLHTSELHSTHEGADLQGLELQMWLGCTDGLPHLDLYLALTAPWALIYSIYTLMHAEKEQPHTPDCHISTRTHTHTHRHSQIKTRNQCNL